MEPIKDHPVIQDIVAKTDENAVKIDQNKVSLDKVWAATFDWGAFFQTPIGKAIGVMAVTMLGLMITQINTWMQPTPPIIVNVPPPSVSAPVDPVPVEAKKVEPKKIETARVAPMKLICYTLDGKTIDTKAFGEELSVIVTTDAKAWPLGSYKFNNKTVLFPAGVLYTNDMKTIIDAIHYDKIDDLVALVKAHPQGK